MGVRALQRTDLPAVAELYQRVVVGEQGPAPTRLGQALERATLDHPWAEEDLPSLVYEDHDDRIVGFQAAYARRFAIGERALRTVCCGQLVADPEASTLGIGGRLMKRMLDGAQDATITDGATAEVRGMWSRLGGSTGGLTSIQWTRVFHAARFAAHLAARHQGRARRPASSGLVEPSRAADLLTPELLIDLVDRTRMLCKPAYDERFLTWLFAELEAVDGRGALSRQVVRDQRGAPIGWFVAFLPTRGVAQAIGIGGVRPEAIDPVIDALLGVARAHGCIAIQGRAEHALLPTLSAKRFLLRRADWALAKIDDDQLAAAAGREQVLTTRMDGEWWMGYHLDRRAPWGATTSGRTDRVASSLRG